MVIASGGDGSNGMKVTVVKTDSGDGDSDDSTDGDMKGINLHCGMECHTVYSI